MTNADKPEPSHWLDPPTWWRKLKPLRWLVALLIAVWVLNALDLMRFVKLPEKAIPAFLKPEPHPDSTQYTRVAVGVTLCDRFRSYEDLQSVTSSLSASGYEQWTTNSRRAVESSSYPPYGFDTVKVQDYVHLDSRGKLTFQFFNNRLYQVEFVPTDAEAYARKLRVLDLPRDANARAEKVTGNLRVASTVDLAISTVGRQLRTEPFVIWQDLRLVRERDQWDEKFGSIPKQIVGG
jgi:hypothetical protein